MAINPSILWLVGLILCCWWSQINSMAIKMIRSPEAFNTSVELKCEPSSADAGVFWMFQPNGHTIRSIFYVSARGKKKPEAVNGYEANKVSNYYHLIITSFQEENQGIYYCLLQRNQILTFSSGLSVYLPKTTTQPPTVPHQITTRSKGQAAKEPTHCPDPTVSDGDLSTMFSCELYIWAPLAGGCFILLISLLITISVCCDPRRRRRRCKCKRPMNGANGALPLPRKNP